MKVAGEKPPELGQVFPEDLPSRAVRKRSSRVPFSVDTQQTYTFSVKCDYVDMLAWTLVRIPFAHHKPLQSILGTKTLQLVAYAIDEDKHKRKHDSRAVQTVFRINFTHS